tara:strand:- start:351 stop:5702 length:5352 start_codon:yes stop_codon:yes gene_type:complete
MDDERLGQPIGISSLFLQIGKKAADTQLARGDITKDEYDEIIRILYPPLSLVDDKKNGGVPRFQSGAATMAPGPSINLDDILKRLSKASRFIGTRVPLLSNLITTPMGDGTLDGYTQEELAGMIAQPEDKEKNINKAIINTPEGVIYAPDPPEEIDLEEWKKRNILSTPVNPPPTFEDMTSGGGFTPVDPEDIPRNTGDPIPEIELPTHTGHPIPAPKTLDDYILTMSDDGYSEKELEVRESLLAQGHSEQDVDFFLHTQFWPERKDSALADIKARSDRFLETYNEPLTRNPGQERISVKSFADLVPEGDAEMEKLKKDFTDEYNAIASLDTPQKQIEALKKLKDATGDTMYGYLINRTPNRKYNYTNLAAGSAVDTRLANPNDPYAIKVTKQNLITDYWVDKAAQYAADENVPMITDADGNMLPALNQDTFFDANKAIADLKAKHSNHPNPAVAKWFQDLPEGALGARRIRAMFAKQGPDGRVISYTEDIRNAVQQNVGYINDSLIPEKSFRSRMMANPKLNSAISMAARRLDMDESFVRKQTENFLAEYFRSRDSGLRSGQSGVMDADLTKKLIEDSGLFNPLSENFMATNKEYIAYLNKRKEQLPGMDLSHKSMTQNPTESDIAAFSGAEELSTGYLPEQTNREIQRRLEADAKIALREKDYKTLERLDREADKYGIETKVVVGGETYSLGMRTDENYEFVEDEFITKYGDELDKFRNGGTLKFNNGSRINDYDPYDINQFQMGQLPSYESLYGDQGKFPVDPDKIEAMRQAALAEGKKFIGDATQFEIFKDGLYNLPDGVVNYFAGSAEGIGELVMGTLAATMKGAQIATSTDPNRITQLLEEPAFTKYMGAYRGKIPRLNLADQKISGIGMDQMMDTIGYYTGPPTAVFTAPFTLGKMMTGAAKVSPEISKVSKLTDTEEVLPGISKVDETVDETIEVTPKRTETKTVTDPEPTIEKTSIDENISKQIDENTTAIAPRWSNIDDHIRTKYNAQPKTKKKLSQWKKELEDADGAGLKNEMKDTGMSLQLSKLIDEGGDQTITAAQFLKIGEELLNNSNQISKGYSSAVASTNLGDLAGAAKAGNEITPDVTRQLIKKANNDLTKIPITAPGKTGRVLQEYKMAVQNMINELEVLAGGTSKRTFKGVENPSVVIEKYTSTILPNILRKANNPNINLLFTEAQNLNKIVDRFKRANVNPRLTEANIQVGWPGTRVEDYSTVEQGFSAKKGQSGAHEKHSSSHPSSPYSISFSRSIDQTTTDGRVTENIMEAQSDVHRGSTSYKSPEDLEGIDILEAAEKKLKPKADKAIDDAWNQFSKDHKSYNFDTDPINMPGEVVPDMFEAQLKSGTADNPIWEVINTRTKKKVPKKSFATEDDAQIFIDAKNKLEASKEAKKPKPTSFDVKVDQVSMDLFNSNFKGLNKANQQAVKRAILDNYGTVNQKMIDDANEFLSGLTTASKKELGKAKNPNFLNAQRISKLKVGDSAFGNYDKLWSRKMTTGSDGQKALIERLANMDELPRTAQTMSGFDRAQAKIKQILDNAQGGMVTEGMYAGTDAFTAIKAEIQSTTGLPVEEFLAKIYPDEVKFAGEYSDLAKNAKLRRDRYETGTQDYPFKKQKDWVKNVLKSHIEKAIQEGKTNVSWNPGEIVGVYESANAKDIAGYKTIYNKLMVEAAEDLNKDIVARAVKLGIDPDQAKIKISGVGEDMNFTLQFEPSNISAYESAAPDLVRSSFDGRKMEVSGLPYVDFSESLDIIRKIGLPQHADGGRVGSSLPEIDEMIGRL